MKKVNLKFKIMFYVPSWGSEITEGWATKFKHIKYLSEYESDYLFFPIDGSTPRIISANEIFENYNQAVMRLEREKQDHINYHKKQIEKSSQFLKENGVIE